VFDDERLHRYTGGAPATADQLRDRFGRQVTGTSPDGSEIWLNWMLRRRDTGDLVGTVQATVRRSAGGLGNGERVAEVAWVVAVGQQHHGYAREAAAAMTAELRRRGVHRFLAHIHPDHEASVRVARFLGLRPTDIRVDGEIRWVTGPR
jgi:RimJ/RimL family protein N-acetyltransferase